MAQGNPNPSPETRFKKGQSGNPGGKTSAQRKAEVKAAEIAKQIEARLLSALAAQSDAELIKGLTGGDITRLVKNAMDREYGTPTQKVEASGAGGGPLVVTWKNADS